MPFVILFIFGLLAASFALILELLVVSLFSLTGYSAFSFFTFAPEHPVLLHSLVTLFCFAFVEEASKLALLKQFTLRFSEKLPLSTATILLSGIVFGSGFATAEIALAVTLTSIPSPSALVGAVGIHLLTGCLFAFAFFSHTRRFSPIIAIILAVVLHTLYNVSIAIGTAAY